MKSDFKGLFSKDKPLYKCMNKTLRVALSVIGSFSRSLLTYPDFLLQSARRNRPWSYTFFWLINLNVNCNCMKGS